jgi:hypothetical protein
MLGVCKVTEYAAVHLSVLSILHKHSAGEYLFKNKEISWVLVAHTGRQRLGGSWFKVSPGK